MQWSAQSAPLKFEQIFCPSLLLLYLKGAVAKDFGEDRCREEGDDRQEDCYAGCDDNDYVDVDIAKKIGTVVKR